MNALESYLIKLIKTQGPISIAGFMAEAMGNEAHGYYMKKDPLGKQGDFTTAPEISQMFGEIIGLWFADIWLKMGAPNRVHMIEVGPGRGTLMKDMMRAMKAVPDLAEALKIHLVEMSPTLRDIQEKMLKKSIRPTWHNRIGEILEQIQGEPIFIVANEFFDALPIHQFQKTPTGWHERLVCLDQDENLSLQLAPIAAPERLIPSALHRADNGSIAEVCSIGENILEEIATHIEHFGGTALIIDYGHDHHGTGDTLQAVKGHNYVDVLSDPGDADLTTHVNFQRLKEIALSSETQVHGPVTQGNFLISLGIETRAKRLMTKATASQKEDIASALNRLTDESQMGTLFKVMAFSNVSTPEPIGFGI